VWGGARVRKLGIQSWRGGVWGTLLGEPLGTEISGFLTGYQAKNA